MNYDSKPTSVRLSPDVQELMPPDFNLSGYMNEILRDKFGNAEYVCRQINLLEAQLSRLRRRQAELEVDSMLKNLSKKEKSYIAFRASTVGGGVLQSLQSEYDAFVTVTKSQIPINAFEIAIRQELDSVVEE